MHAPVRLTLSPTTSIRHIRQTYPRCFQRAYTPLIRPPLGRTSTANDAGVGQADAGGSSLPWDRSRPPDLTGGLHGFVRPEDLPTARRRRLIQITSGRLRLAVSVPPPQPGHRTMMLAQRL